MNYKKYVLKNSYLSNVYGIARTLLAIGTLSTLLFNKKSTLFLYGLENDLQVEPTSITKISLFFLIDNYNIALSISIFILLLVITGIYPRLTGVFHWWVSYSLSVSSYLVDGGDQIAALLTFFLIPITLLDRRKNHWSRPITLNYTPSLFLFFTTILLKLQVAIIYFHAGIAKLFVPEWLNGSAVYYWFNSQNFGAPQWFLYLADPFLRSPFIITMITWGTMFFEIILFASIFIQNFRIKKYLFWSGITFHFLILLVHGLFSFFFSMSGALILLLIYPTLNSVNYKTLK